MSVLFYRRPDYVQRAPGYLNDSDCQKYVERTKCSKHRPPPELSFDRIINNQTLPPCTLGDFMDYMIYVAQDAEQLQFFIWFRDFVNRYDTLPPSDKALSPEWKYDSIENPSGPAAAQSPDEKWDEIAVKVNEAADSSLAPASVQQEEQVSQPDGDDQNWPLKPPPDTAGDDEFTRFVQGSVAAQQNRSSSQTLASVAHAQAGLKWQGFSIQPFRAEITRIIAHYIAPGAPRELPLTHRTRAAVLHALQNTTHPSAFAPAVHMIETALRHQAHPSFIRWSICNGNKPRVFFVRVQGILHTTLGFVLAILLILSHVSRWWRIFAAIEWFLGISTLIAAYKGLCVILHTSHKRNVKPWQDPASLYSTYTGPLTEDEDGFKEAGSPRSIGSGTSRHGEGAHNFSMNTTSEVDEMKASLDTFGSANDAYLSTEGWVQRYRRKNVITKIFDKSVKIQEGTLCVMQDKIARQAQLWAVLWAIVLTVVFTAIPKGNFY